MDYLLNIIRHSLCHSGKAFHLHVHQKDTNADFFMTKTADEEDFAVLGEFKSTQNLLLPLKATEVVSKYQEAYNDVILRREPRPNQWPNICHPFGQLLGHLTDSNFCRYGVLTSSTRTYFVHIEGTMENACACISDAYFPGQVNYLRAWAYVQSIGCQNNVNMKYAVPREGKFKWIRTSRNESTPSPKKAVGASGTNKRKRPHDKRSKSSNTKKSGTCSLSLPWVDFYDININRKESPGSG